MDSKLIKTTDKVFIAGAAGMAGSAISRALTKQGYINQLKPSRKELNLLDFNEVKNWFNYNRPNVVIIAAAKVGGIYANNKYPAEFLLENMKIQNNVMENAFNSGSNRLLFLGSSCIYPKFSQQPIKEESLLTGSLEPTNQWYAVAKIAGIKLATALRKQYNFDSISLMPTNLYGKGDNYHPENSHVLPALIRRIHEAKVKSYSSIKSWGTGRALREFLNADDLGEACLFALENWKPNLSNSPKDNNGDYLEFLNVGSGIEISIKELAKTIARTIGYKGELLWDNTKPDGTPKKQLNISRLNEMGWQAKISLDEGLEIAYQDFCHRLDSGTLRY